MAEPLSDERLEAIRWLIRLGEEHDVNTLELAVAKQLLAEIERQRAIEQMSDYVTLETHLAIRHELDNAREREAELVSEIELSEHLTIAEAELVILDLQAGPDRGSTMRLRRRDICDKLQAAIEYAKLAHGEAVDR